MTCPKCGSEAPAEAVECQRCGVIFANVKPRPEAVSNEAPTPAPLPPVPERKRPAADSWLEHVRAYADMTPTEQHEWFGTLTLEQQREFTDAWNRMAMNVPKSQQVTCPRNCGNNWRP